MRTVHYCEKCGLEFQNKDECSKHEVDCKVTFLCQKCGKIISWNGNDKDAFIKANQCHTVDLDVMGYGSKLDGLNVVFDICDDCLFFFIDTFRYKEDILSSTDEWMEEYNKAFKGE